MSYKVHPGIGVARIGDSPESYTGPTVPGTVIAPSGGFRDSDCRIRRQNAEFRLYEHGSGDPVEVTPSATTTIRWKVRLAIVLQFNTEINPALPIHWVAAELSIDAPGTAVFPSSGRPLAEIEMLPSGRLLVRSAVFDLPHRDTSTGDRLEGYVRADVVTSSQTDELSM